VKAGWTTTTLGDLLSVQNGYAFDSKLFGAEGYPLIRIRDIKEGITTETKFSGSFDSKYVVNAGDFLIGMDGEFGCHEWKGPPALLNQRVCRLQGFHNSLEPRFLLHGINAHLKAIEEVTGYTTVKHLSSKQILAIEMLVPPRTEQHRIATLLDEAFADIVTAKANAEKNLQNAEVLFQSQLQALFNRPSSGRVQTTLGKATGGIFTGPFGSLLHKHDYVEKGIPLVNPAHISAFGIEPDYRKTVSSETASRLANYIMRSGDIVIGRRGEMGRCALITDMEDGWLCGTGSFFIKPSNRCDAAYLVHLLRSEGCKQQLEKIAGGAVMPNLSNTDLSSFVVELPSIDEQKRIVAQIELAGQDVERLKTIYRQKLTALDDLKKSLLHQAFSGQLT
jgi:type I restriction enzyme S subunit